MEQKKGKLLLPIVMKSLQDPAIQQLRNGDSPRDVNKILNGRVFKDYGDI